MVITQLFGHIESYIRFFLIFQRFKELSQGRTAIIISHRLSTVKMADYIYFLKDGRITESGTHRELVERRGMYAQMFEIQARHYR